MNRFLLIKYCTCLLVTLCCLSRVGVYSNENDSITLKMFNPGYIFNTLQTLCLKFNSDIDLLLKHDELYEQWITASDYILDQSLELYTYISYMLLFKHEMHSYLEEDTAYITHLIQQASHNYYALMQNKNSESIHALFIPSILQKIVSKSLLLINLTKEICIPFYKVP